MRPHAQCIRHTVRIPATLDPATELDPVTELAPASELDPASELVPATELVPASELVPATELVPAPTRPRRLPKGKAGVCRADTRFRMGLFDCFVLC